MLSVKAKYDVKQLKFAEKVEVSNEEDVRVVFLNRKNLIQADISGTQIQTLLMDSGSLSFLESDKEEVYSDKDLKVKYWYKRIIKFF